MKINSLFLILILILFLGCTHKVTYVNEMVEPNNPIVKMKHYNIMVPNGTPIKWNWIRTIFSGTNVIISHNLNHFDKNRKTTGSIWKNYSLEIRTYPAEKENVIKSDKEHYIKQLQAIKNKDGQYLLDNIKNHPSYKNDGIISVEYGNVNKYPAIVITSKTKYMDMDEYSKEYWLYSYSKTGKLKAYVITISVSIDKPEEYDPQLLVEYSFEDMLKRSQRSLDSFTPTDEDF